MIGHLRYNQILMLEFKITKKSNKSAARLGILETAHGQVQTPAFVPVATQASIKALDSDLVGKTKSQLLIANTFHLYLRPGPEVIYKAGGLHNFMNWSQPLMTDSGGFQVFSLGFGKDLQVGKINSKQAGSLGAVTANSKPNEIKIVDHGVYFRSPHDGKELFIGPKESIAIQEKIGADIMFAFDECTAPLADFAYTRKSLERTHAWAKQCLASKKTKQALFGVVQGGRFENLRKQSAKYLAGLNFEGFGIGGEFGDDKKQMSKMIDWVVSELPEDKPRHLLGIGHLEDIPKIMAAGIDTFDCIVPTQYARRAIAFTSSGKLNLVKKIFAEDYSSLDPRCSCLVCRSYSKSYIHHLFRAHEISAMSLTTFHNLVYFNNYVASLRKKIAAGLL